MRMRLKIAYQYHGCAPRICFERKTQARRPRTSACPPRLDACSQTSGCWKRTRCQRVMERRDPRKDRKTPLYLWCRNCCKHPASLPGAKRWLHLPAQSPRATIDPTICPAIRQSPSLLPSLSATPPPSPLTICLSPHFPRSHRAFASKRCRRSKQRAPNIPELNVTWNTNGGCLRTHGSEERRAVVGIDLCDSRSVFLFSSLFNLPSSTAYRPPLYKSKMGVTPKPGKGRANDRQSAERREMRDRNKEK